MLWFCSGRHWRLAALPPAAGTRGRVDWRAYEEAACESSSSSSSSSSSGVPARPPRIPPLPYWCDGVAVVGLPDDQLVFCFQTPTQASATARRQLRPEAPYGASAVKLAALSADKAQAILDKWQYAVAQREVASLAARPGMLWWKYGSAIKSLQQRPPSPAEPGSASSGGKARPRSPSADSGKAAAAPAAEAASSSSAATAREAEALTRRQRRQAAKLAKAAAKAAAKAERREQRLLRRRLRREERAAAEASEQRQQQAEDRGGGGLQGQQLGTAGSQQRMTLSARPPSWELATLRALPDGTVIYKFGGYEALPDPASLPLPRGDNGSSSSSESGGEEGGEVKLGLLRQQLLRSQEGVSWSNALRLSSKYPDQAVELLEKLQAFVSEWEQRQGSERQFNSRLHRPYHSALTRVQKRAAELGWLPEGQEDAAAAGIGAAAGATTTEQGAPAEGLRTSDEAQSSQQQQRQQKREKRRKKEQQQEATTQVEGSSKSPTATTSSSSSDSFSSSTSGASSGSGSPSTAQVAGRAAAAPAAETAVEPPLEALASKAGGDSQEGLTGKPQRESAQLEQQGAGETAGLLPPGRQLEQQSQPASQQQQQHQADHSGHEQTAAEQQQPLHHVLALLMAAAAAAAGLGAALRRLAGQAATAAACWALALYRRLPVAFRRLFWRSSWPPKWSVSHVSPTLAAILDGAADARQLAAAGFDNQGRTSAPLADLPAWRVEQLTLAGVRDLGLYRAAFTHKSALALEERTEKSFERLEFLGDSVLGLTCRTLLMQRRPSSDEGEMTRLQGVLVSGAAAARYAAWLGLDRYLLMELKGLREAAQHTPAILADVFEALLGAIHLDQGFEVAQRFCTRVLDAAVDWDQLAVVEDWKGMLSRFAALKNKPQPRYSVRAISQREYKEGLSLKWWKVDVHFQGSVMGTGGSFDKRHAEQLAARMALDKLGQLPSATARNK
ncbi:hypothetical protein ABPG77_004757 [Micractinium sp. CCAP 211/92]